MTTPPQHPLGRFLQDGDRIGLRFERHFRHPPELVWRAITESSSLRHWLPCDIVGPRRAGAEVQLPFWPDLVEHHRIEQPLLTGRILRWEPPHVFEWQWERDTLHFELEADGAGTRFTFTTWIEDRSAGLADTAGGYHACLDNLAGLLDTGAAPALVDHDPEAYAARYVEHVPAGA